MKPLCLRLNCTPFRPDTGNGRRAWSVVRFTLLAASGMIGNQRLQHFGEPRGKSFRSDTLGGNAGALA
jgi:hypothetical protein